MSGLPLAGGQLLIRRHVRPGARGRRRPGQRADRPPVRHPFPEPRPPVGPQTVESLRPPVRAGASPAESQTVLAASQPVCPYVESVSRARTSTRPRSEAQSGRSIGSSESLGVGAVSAVPVRTTRRCACPPASVASQWSASLPRCGSAGPDSWLPDNGRRLRSRLTA